MEDAEAQLATLQANNAADAKALAALEEDLSTLSSGSGSDDTVVEAVIKALEDAGFTVTGPTTEPALPAGSETSDDPTSAEGA